MENDKKQFSNLLKVVLIGILAFWGINNFNVISGFIDNIFKIIFPFILGGALAFILNIPMSFFEKKLSSIKIKKKKIFKEKSAVVRIISMILAFLVISIVLYLVINLVVPELIDIVKLLISNIPYYVEEIKNFLNNNTENIQEVNEIISSINFDIDSIKKEAISLITKALTSSISIISGIIGFFTNLIISIIFAVYILMSKEKLTEQSVKIIEAYFNEKHAKLILEIGRNINSTFKNFFTVQCLEATILGTLCVIGMSILKIPYAVPIGVLVGVTALIPVVGAFIGIIIGAILIVSVAPIKVITFIVFVLILQQIEGNVIYPKVVGTSVGLPGMWVLVAVTVGGSLFGILGMLLGVPTASVFYSVLKKDTNSRLENKKIENSRKV